MEPRVIHVTADYPPLLSGLGKVVESLAVTRAMQGLEVGVLTAMDGQRRTADCSKKHFVRYLRSWNVAHTAIMPGLPCELLKLARNSIIHLHIGRAFTPEVVYAAHLFRRLPYVAHVHGDVGPSGRAGFLLHIYKRLVLRTVLRAAATVVVPTSEHQLIFSSQYGIDPARIAVIPNGVDETFVYTGQRQLHRKPRLLFVGRLDIQKNVLLFLRALAGVSEWFETTLVGNGELEIELRQAAYELGLQNVSFHGRADGTELRELYRNADVFVLPSEYEGMPLVLLEALAMGLPIVATDIPGNRDLVVHGGNGFLVPLGDPQALRGALLSVTADINRYRRMSETSRKISRKYSWTAVGAEFERIYAQASKC